MPTRARLEMFVLRLYVAGQTERSVRAIRNLNRICEEHLPGAHEIEVIDLLQEPVHALEHNILALPTLIRRAPEPIVRVIGDLSDHTKVLHGLQIELDLEG